MRRTILLCLLSCVLILSAVPTQTTATVASIPFVRLHTEAGAVLLVLFPDLAPNHANNFLHLAGTGFFDGITFHRIVPGFVIQGGDPNTKDRDPRTDGMGGPTLSDVLTETERAELQKASGILEARGYTGLSLNSRANLRAEFSPTARHLRGTLSMARSRDNDSAGSQFFICVDRAAQLDRQYTVFGHAVTGMDTVDEIVSAPVDRGRSAERPLEPVKILRTEVMTGLNALTADEQAAYHEALRTIAEAGSSW